VVLHRRSERPLPVAMMMLSNLAEAAQRFQIATRMRQHCELLRIPHTISPSFPESDIEVEMLRAGIRSASRILANRGLSAAVLRLLTTLQGRTWVWTLSRAGFCSIPLSQWASHAAQRQER
jgi:hypothetical protein